MSGSGMIAARPEGLAVNADGDDAGEAQDGAAGDVLITIGCVTIDDRSEPGSWAAALGAPTATGADGYSYRDGAGVLRGPIEGCASGWDDFPIVDHNTFADAVRAYQARHYALGILMLGAAKCTEVAALADSGRIERDGADLFIRRYSESICDIVAALVPVSRNGSN